MPAPARRAGICSQTASDPHALRGIDPAKLLAPERAQAPLADWQTAKESAGASTWTYVLYGTEAMAAEAGLSLEQYWEQIIAACFLDQPDPRVWWREVSAEWTCPVSVDSSRLGIKPLSLVD